MAAVNIPSPLANLTWLDFTPERNCALAGQVVGTAILEAEDASPLGEATLEDLDASSISISESLMEFVRTSGPTPLVDVAYEQIRAWNTDMLGTNMSILNLTDQVDQHCHLDLCRNMDFGGNPDLSGIGVSCNQMTQRSGTYTIPKLC